MCEKCWVEYGSPRIDNEGVRKAALEVEQLYGEHAAGGALHVAVDDWNLETLAWCIETNDLDEVEQRAADALSALSLEEQASALAFEQGFWR